MAIVNTRTTITTWSLADRPSFVLKWIERTPVRADLAWVVLMPPRYAHVGAAESDFVTTQSGDKRCSRQHLHIFADDDDGPQLDFQFPSQTARYILIGPNSRLCVFMRTTDEHRHHHWSPLHTRLVNDGDVVELSDEGILAR